MLAPAALSLITVTFQLEKERAKAFAVFGAIAGGGAAIGLLLGGFLTQYLSWRWCFFVNIPIAIPAAFFASRILRESQASTEGTTTFPVPCSARRPGRARLGLHPADRGAGTATR